MKILEEDKIPEFSKAPDNAVEEQKPFLTTEQYVEMAEINARVRELKQLGFDIRELLDNLRSEMGRLEGELDKTRNELIAKTQDMQTCFQQYIYEPFNMTGQIVVADTEPHYITQVPEAGE